MNAAFYVVLLGTLLVAGYPDLPNFGLPPKICQINAAAENAAKF